RAAGAAGAARAATVVSGARDGARQARGRVEVEVAGDARAEVPRAQVLNRDVDTLPRGRVDVDRSLARISVVRQVDEVRVPPIREERLAGRVIGDAADGQLRVVRPPALRLRALDRLQRELDVRAHRVALEVGHRLDAVRLVGGLRDAGQDLARGEVHGRRDDTRERGLAHVRRIRRLLSRVDRLGLDRRGTGQMAVVDVAATGRVRGEVDALAVLVGRVELHVRLALLVRVDRNRSRAVRLGDPVAADVLALVVAEVTIERERIPV